MVINDYPRLCGGTFFTLVLQALRQRTEFRNHFHASEKVEGLTEPAILVGLIKVIYPGYLEPRRDQFAVPTSHFKSCRISQSERLPFGNTPEVESFNQAVLNEYDLVLQRMEFFVNQFLEVGSIAKKDVGLVKAILELIQLDESISDSEEFYILKGGGKIKKAALGSLTEIDLSPFLLGVWHYTVINRADNLVGRSTYDTWCPPHKYTRRPYVGNMGKAISQNIIVHVPNSTDEAPLPSDILSADSQSHSAAQSMEITSPNNIYIPASIDREYYNLIVFGSENIETNYIRMPKGRVLSAYMSDATRALFGELTPEVIRRIKTMPSLFMGENRRHKKPDDDQFVVYGFISDIKIYETDIKIYFSKYRSDIPQSVINGLQSELSITGQNRFDELMYTHWAIKRVDLIEELCEAQVQIPLYTMQDSAK